MADEAAAAQAHGERVEIAATSAGQRRINAIWEITQAVIALSVTVQTLRVAGSLTLTENSDKAAFLLLSNAFFLVIGFYFGRTNHVKTGGIGFHAPGQDR